jgi:thymidylate synthase (FAD)
MEQIKVELQEFMGSDKAIAHAAWTSSTDLQRKEMRSPDDIERIVGMLVRDRHPVPFEYVVMRFWMRIPIATDRQIMTHRIASHSGMSGRYRTMPTDYYLMPDDVKGIMFKLPEGNEQYAIYDKVCLEANGYYSNCMASFKSSRDSGIITNDEYKRLREFYRGMLPQHNMTERVSMFNLRSWANFYGQRSKLVAQPEVRKVAEMMHKAVIEAKIAPVAIAGLESINWDI